MLPKAADVHLNLEMQPAPVITRGARGEWDAVDVLNPSVIANEKGYLNLYSGFDGRTWHTGLATSADGVHWSKAGKVLSPDTSTWEGSYIAANGSVLQSRNQFYYWYQAGAKETPRIGLARSQADSSDARHWNKESHPVLDFGPRGSWDERGLGDPYVIQIGEWFYMYYTGLNRARQQRLGLARSHDGIHWEKLRSNPVMELPWPGTGWIDDNGAGEPAVWQSHGFYWMLFTGRDAHENRALGLAHSLDGVHWNRHNLIFRGEQDWNRKVLCDPTVIVSDGRIRVWFGGGDVASPDENLHGQIGFGELRPFTPRPIP
jgi:predicted GH43/DUF377 family glycosyl hydrolase